MYIRISLLYPFAQKPKGSRLEILEKKVDRASAVFINMKPFISFRSEDFNGNYTLVFDGNSESTRQLLRKLASMGALDVNAVKQLKQRDIL